MDIKENFKVLLTDLDITDLRKAVLDAPQSEWDENKIRQSTFSVAKATQAIIFKFNGPTQGIEHPSETRTLDAWDKWKPLVEPFVKQLQSLYPNSVVSKCFIPKLLSKGIIGKHVDSGPTLEMSHRLHIPLSTNKDALFTVDDETIHMKEGVAYEINNTKEHYVVNNGSTDRIHLMIDLYCEEEWNSQK